MECTGIDECEYVEFRFKVVKYHEWLQFTGRKGSFAVYEDGKVVYNATISNDDSQILYWTLASIKSDFVPKDPAWLPTGIEAMTSFWSEVLKHRAAGTTPPPPPSKIPTIDL
jgi:hypothetical protein